MMEEVVEKLAIASFIHSTIYPKIFIENISLLSEHEGVNKTSEVLLPWNFVSLECGCE